MQQSNKLEETLIYEGFGFPIELIDAPMKKVLGEWIIDIDLNALQAFVFHGLIYKPRSLTGNEMKFMRKYLGISTKELGKKLGVSHAAIVKWEKEQTKIAPIQETYLRIFFLECSNSKDLLDLYKKIRPEDLAKTKNKSEPPFSINVRELYVA